MRLLIVQNANISLERGCGSDPAYKKYLMIINLVGAHGTKRKNKVSFCGENTKATFFILEILKRGDQNTQPFFFLTLTKRIDGNIDRSDKEVRLTQRRVPFQTA